MDKKKNNTTTILISIGIIGVILAVIIYVASQRTEPGKTPPPQIPVVEAIPGLTSIKGMASMYKEGNSQDPAGISLNINFYNDQGKNIRFQNVPVKVKIEFLGYLKDAPKGKGAKTFDVMYTETVSLDHSMKREERGRYIRIPYEKIAADQDKYAQYGTLKVNVEVPGQGSFSDDPKAIIKFYPD